MATEQIPGAELSAIHCNRFHVYVEETTRIAFGESVGGGDVKYHAAISLSRSNAVELANLLLKFLAVPAEKEVANAVT